jgi:hypothetical protein
LEWINIKLPTTTDELNENITAYSNILVGFLKLAVLCGRVFQHTNENVID